MKPATIQSQWEIQDAIYQRVLLLTMINVEKVTGTRFVGMDGVPKTTSAEQPIIINQLIKPGTILSQREIQHAKY